MTQLDKVLWIIAIVGMIGVAVSGTLVAHPPKWLVTSHHMIEPR